MAGAVWRVRERSAFTALRRSRHRARRGPVTVTWVPLPEGGPPRVAFAVGRRVGGAVVRNRLRRRLRAIVATRQLPPGLYLISVAPEAATLSYGELSATVTEACNALESQGVS